MTQILPLLFLPNLLHSFDHRTQWVLTFTFLHIGNVDINLLFLIKAAVFLVILIVLSRLLQRLVVQQLLGHLHISPAQRFALGRFITYAFFLGGVFVAIQSLGVNLNSLVVFGGAIGVGVGLGLQNVVSNFVAGLILLVEQPIRMGDRVEINNTLGDVVRIAARSVWIRTNDNIVIVVPNSDFINNPVTNVTGNDPRVRLHLPVGVGYNSDVELVRDLLLRVAAENASVLREPGPDVMFVEYGDSSLNFDLRFWTEVYTHTPQVIKSQLYFAALKLFRENGIELPFPQRDLNIRTSEIPLPYPGPNSGPNSRPDSGPHAGPQRG